MRILLVSTYELGHQPIHLASPAAALHADGHDVRCLDLAVEEPDASILDGVEAVAFSVPMHTAMRLAVTTARRIKSDRPDTPIAFYGLYADVGRDRNLGVVTDAIFCGEYEPALRSWASSLVGEQTRAQVRVHLGRSEFLIPRRVDLPPLDRYARVEMPGGTRIAGAVEASHGCRHRCRHCPIPAVYGGRIRIVGHETVLADIGQLVAAGAEHITFADADFLNAPAYSISLLREAHRKFPSLTFDITVKVEHILKYRDMWPEMAELGLLFVISAFESVDSDTLEILDKSHSVADMVEATEVLQGLGIHLRPTWLPFLPWTKPRDIADIFTFLDAYGLSGAIDPVQMAIRVLVPEGSLLVDHPVVRPYLSHFDAEALTWLWEFDDPDTARLSKELDRIAGAASDCMEEASDTLEAMRGVITEISGVQLGPQPASPSAPRLSESWFCCAEPTVGQASAVTGMTIGGLGG